MAYPFELGEVTACISGRNRMCQPYIESTTVLSDKCLGLKYSYTLSIY